MKKKIKKRVDDFVHLHTHSDFSPLDGCARIGEYADLAKARNHRALCMTEHGNMRGYLTLHKESEEHNLKPIYGIEFYLCDDMRRKGVTEEETEELTKDVKKASKRKEIVREYEKSQGLRERSHLTVWAKNDRGLQSLYELSSKSWIEGFYYKPRIDVGELIKHKEGLIVGAGCVGSLIYKNVVEGKTKKAARLVDLMVHEFEKDFFLEIQPHNLEIQSKANKFALQMKKRYPNLKMLATQDAHYVGPNNAINHDVLLCIGTNNFMRDPNRFRFTGDEFYFKTRKEMFESFRTNHGYIPKELVIESLNSTLLFPDLVTAKIDVDSRKAYLPKAEIPKRFKTDWQYLEYLCLVGWNQKDLTEKIRQRARRERVPFTSLKRTYLTRLEKELRVLREQDFVNYFLIFCDLYQWVKSVGIQCGPGRGSVAGSLVSYLLGFTVADPIEHGLIFERFLAPGRTDYPDIDADFEDQRRDEIFDYLREKYGEEYVAQVSTVGKLKGKNCVKDVARVFSVPFPESNAITPHIIQRARGDARRFKTVEDSFEAFDSLKKFNQKYPDVLEHAKYLEGMSKSVGIHAAGVVIAPKPLTRYIPLETRRSDGRVITVTALDKWDIPALGLVKLDILGLKTLTVIRECLEEIERYYGERIDLEELELNDSEVLEQFTNHKYVGVFQFDTASAEKVSEGITFDTFEDIVALNAFNRPGPSQSGLTAKWRERKKDPEKAKVHTYHETVSEIAKDTFGVLAYQEHIIKIFTDIAGFNIKKADNLRKSIAKSKGIEELEKEREGFVQGAIQRTGMSERVANALMDAVSMFGRYAFNKSHATSYSIISYYCMYLKTYYPLEFFWALLRTEDKKEKIQEISTSIRNEGVKVLPPHINVSGKNFTIDREEGAIRGSLIDIKGIGEAGSQNIIDSQPSKSFFEFLAKTDRRKVTKAAVYALLCSGSFRGVVYNTKWLVENFDSFWGDVKKLGIDSKKVRNLYEESKNYEDYSDDEMSLISAKVNPVISGKNPVLIYQDIFKNVLKIKLTPYGGGFYQKKNDKQVFLLGNVVGTKLNRVGDYHTGEIPSDDEKKKMNWGQTYGNVNIENEKGDQVRIKFDTHVYHEAEKVIKMGAGTVVLIHGTVSGQWNNIRGDFIISLEELRNKLKEKQKLKFYEHLVLGRHPAKLFNWAEKVRQERLTNAHFFKSKVGAAFCGVPISIKTRIDKNGSPMAWVNFIDASNHTIQAVFFGSFWPEVEQILKLGKLCVGIFEGDRKGAYIYNGSGIKSLKIKKIRAKK